VEALEARENPSGNVDASLSAGGVLKLTGDALDNDIQIQLTAAGAVITGQNGTTITANGSVGGAATLTGSVRSVIASMKDGNDRVAIDSALGFALDGNATFHLGDGNNTLVLDTAGVLDIDGHLKVRAGDGLDDVSIQGGVNSSIGKSINVALGGGGSVVSIDDVSIDGAAGLKIAAGAGTDVVTLDGVIVSRAGASISGGLDALDVDVTGVANIDRNLSVRGRGAVDVGIAGGAFGGIHVKGGSLADTTVNVNGSATVDGSVSVRGFNASLGVNSGDFAVNGNLAVAARNNATLNVAANSLNVGRHLTVAAGTRADVDFATSGSANVGGKLLVLGGSDGDSITANANLTVDGNLSLLLRGGNNTIELGGGSDLDVNGNLTIVTGSGNDSVTLDQVVVDGRTVILLGAGTDNLTVRNGTSFGALAVIDTGADADVVAIANNVGATAGVTFHGAAVISTGAGDDSIFLGLSAAAGGSTNNRVVFDAPFNVLNAGAGADLFTALNAQIIGNLLFLGLP
jgi:hypothetical protein